MEDRAKPLAGRAALITGSSRNIGRATALALAGDGADILIHGQADAEAAEQTAQDIRSLGVRAAVHLVDITDPDAPDRLTNAAMTAFGRIDIVVCNAAIRRQNPFLDIPLEEFREVISTDLEAPFRLLQTALPMIIEANKRDTYGGRVITLGGTSAYVQTHERAHVVAAKMGLLGITRTIATEFGALGITANMVAPGHVDTSRGTSAGKRSASGSHRLMERFADVSEIAGMIRHLCGPDGAYISGQCIHIDGGTYFGT